MPTTTASTKISKMQTTATYIIAGQVPSLSDLNRYIASACGLVPDPDVAMSTQAGSNLIATLRRRRHGGADRGPQTAGRHRGRRLGCRRFDSVPWLARRTRWFAMQ